MGNHWQKPDDLFDGLLTSELEGRGAQKSNNERRTAAWSLNLKEDGNSAGHLDSILASTAPF